jgi:nucleoside-diphosphate-sugar epimerase
VARLERWYDAQRTVVLRELGEGARLVVDVGCGEGALLRRLCAADPGVAGVGVDVSPARIAAAREAARAAGLCDRLRFVQEDWLAGDPRGFREALAGRRADALVCVSAFHYFSEPLEAAARMLACCAPGGRVLVLDRDTDGSPMTGLWGQLHRLAGDGVRFYRSGELCAVLARAGFTGVGVVSRRSGWLRNGKLHSSLALVAGTRPSAPGRVEGAGHEGAAVERAYAALRGRRLLVTGAAGFLGGHLLRRLRSHGLDARGSVLDAHQARALDREGLPVSVLDLRRPGTWSAPLRGADVVFHLAACFQEVEAGEAEFEEVNHRRAVEFARCASEAGVSRFVHCSTAGVHGDVIEMPATERSPFRPMDVYQRTKLAGEQGILELASGLPADGMVVTVNRPTMAYGPGDRRMGRLFSGVLSGRLAMIGSGLTLAHLGYVEDQTDSFVLCAAAPRARAHREAFNIASDGPLTLDELFALVAECGGVRRRLPRLPLWPVWLLATLCERAFRPLGRRPPLFRRRVAFFTHNRAFDLSKAREALGYVSRWTHREGIRQTLAADAR